MVDLPVGKALAVVESTAGCDGCFLNTPFAIDMCDCVYCRHFQREDGRNVIFRLVDYPAEEEA